MLWSMVIDVNDEQLHTLAQMRAFLDGTVALEFAVAVQERYGFIARTVRRLGYARLKRAEKAARQLARPSLQNSVRSGQHRGGLPIFLGSWQTSNALALQASLCGSVTHRLHHFTAGRMRFRRAS